MTNRYGIEIELFLKELLPFLTEEYDFKVCMRNPSFILNRNSSKLCILVYHHLKFPISVLRRQFDWTIFERVIVLFAEYFICKRLYAQLMESIQFKWDFLKIIYRFTYHYANLIGSNLKEVIIVLFENPPTI